MGTCTPAEGGVGLSIARGALTVQVFIFIVVHGRPGPELRFSDGKLLGHS